MTAAVLARRAEWDELLKSDPGCRDKPASLAIRELILRGGIPTDQTSGAWRSTAWKALLGIESLPAQEYIDLVAKGPSVAHGKICNDSFRTLATDTGFQEKVAEDQLIRVLEAFVWSHSEEDTITADLMEGYEFSYVQGMNVLAAPFLYTMPSELEAYHCFKRFIEACCPLYVQPTLVGVHRGLELLDRCLEVADPELFSYLRSKRLTAELYAFPSVLTLCACTPPLEQVLQLWDFLLAFGVHMNILCVIAQLFLMRDELFALNSSDAISLTGSATTTPVKVTPTGVATSESSIKGVSPMKLLREFPPLQAGKIIEIAVKLATDLPEDLYAQLVEHTYDVDSTP